MPDESNEYKPSAEVPVPAWVTDRGAINETLFIDEFLRTMPMKYRDGEFILDDGALRDPESIKSFIYKCISPFVCTCLNARVESLYKAMKHACRDSSSQPPATDEIYVMNGMYKLGVGFVDERKIVSCRLRAAYNPDAGTPMKFFEFLHDLLHEEDIQALQEYLGYCLIPSTKAQKLLMIIGKGGEGKSCLGNIARGIWGESMVSASISKIECDRFARSMLVNRLLMVDDDMKLEALNKTNNIKTIVTAEQPIDIERKNEPSRQAFIRCKFLCFGNGVLQSLYDRSNGFYRRQMIIRTKDKPKDRKVNPCLADEILEHEKSGILNWLIAGLERLIANNYIFSESQRMKANLLEAYRDGNNAVEFMKSTGYIEKDPEGRITSKNLYDVYKIWCCENGITPMGRQSFMTYLIENQEMYEIQYSRGLRESGRQVRGFIGLKSDIAAYQ